MKKGEIEKFTLRVIAGAVRRDDLPTVRAALSEMIGATLDVSGKVQKVVKREGQEKLVIEPDEMSGFVVFAYFLGKLDTLKAAKVRKGSAVSLRGKLASFGASAVCVDNCKLDQVRAQKKGNCINLQPKKRNKK